MSAKSSKNSPVISVIVPVYNVELYLDRCINSLLKQTFSQFELILVDDGSKDKSGAMCDKWAKKDNRIRVIHKANGGLSDARNTGVKNSVSEWITFIDSDDYVAKDFLLCLTEMIKDFNVDIAMCNFTSTIGDEIATNFVDDKIDIVDTQTACVRACRDVQYGVAVCKLFPREFLLKYPFPVGHVHEDTATVGKLLYCAKNIAVSKKKLYGYFQNPSSITHSPSKRQREDQLWAVTENALFFTEKKEMVIAQSAWEYVALILIYNARPLYVDKSTLSDYLELYMKNSSFCKTHLKVFLAVKLNPIYRILVKIARTIRTIAHHGRA